MHPLSPPRAPGGGLLEVRPGMLESEESWRAGNPGEEGNPAKKEAREGKEARKEARRGKKGKKIEPRAPPAGQTDEKRADFSGTAKLRPPYGAYISVPEPAPPARASRALIFV